MLGTNKNETRSKNTSSAVNGIKLSAQDKTIAKNGAQDKIIQRLHKQKQEKFEGKKE
jgi:hypothetical protein